MKSQFTGALALFSLISGAANASNLTIDYFTVPENTGLADFGTCCSSPPATSPDVALGSALSVGMPVTSVPFGSGGPQMVSGTGQILWWTPGQSGILSDGTRTITLPFGNFGTSNMYPPTGTGTNDSNLFQTAIVSGTFHGDGLTDVQLTVSSDDDALVYLNGIYQGGLQGVHPTQTVTLDFGAVGGFNSLEIFYADRAQVGAELDLNLTGATTNAVGSVPEPSTWAMMLLGFAGIGFMAYRRKSKPALMAA